MNWIRYSRVRTERRYVWILFPGIRRFGLASLLSCLVLFSGCAGNFYTRNPVQIDICTGRIQHTSFIYRGTRTYFTSPRDESVQSIAMSVLAFPIAFPFTVLSDTITLPIDIYNEALHQPRCNRLMKEVELSSSNNAEQEKDPAKR